MSDLPPLTHTELPGDGVRLHAVTCGDPAGPPVVLLHGFPEFWYGWRKQLGPLAAAGFRVVALDQRGYNRSDKPPRVADYAVDKLAADVTCCLDALGVRRAAVVGHDWGGAVAWWLGLTHADRVSRLAVLNCPHPAAMRADLLGNPGQMLRSWYIAAFQIPRLPEWFAGRRRAESVARALTDTSRPGTFTEADVERYREAWLQPGALRAMINWYRANLRGGPKVPDDPTVRVPTLVIWGERDKFLNRTLGPKSVAHCAGGRLVRLPEATHWVQHEEPTRVNELLIAHLRG